MHNFWQHNSKFDAKLLTFHSNFAWTHFKIKRREERRHDNRPYHMENAIQTISFSLCIPAFAHFILAFVSLTTDFIHFDAHYLPFTSNLFRLTIDSQESNEWFSFMLHRKSKRMRFNYADTMINFDPVHFCNAYESHSWLCCSKWKWRWRWGEISGMLRYMLHVAQHKRDLKKKSRLSSSVWDVQRVCDGDGSKINRLIFMFLTSINRRIVDHIYQTRTAGTSASMLCNFIFDFDHIFILHLENIRRILFNNFTIGISKKCHV